MTVRTESSLTSLPDPQQALLQSYTMLRAIPLSVTLLAVVAAGVSALDQVVPKKEFLVGKGVLGLGIEPALYPAQVLFDKPAVQEELKISPSQLQRWRQVVEEQDRDTRIPDMLKAIREELKMNPDPELEEERMAQLRAVQTTIRKEYEAKLTKVLDSRQRDRLGEIQLQAEGPMAFTRPAIQERLNLDPFHIAAIQEIVSEGRQAMTKASEVPNEVFPRGGRAQSRQKLLETKNFQDELEKRRKAMSDARRQTMQLIAKLLTKGQRARYQQMLGEPFDFVKLRPTATQAPSQSEREKETSSRPSEPESKRQ
jgi:hypothetical protein